MPTLNPRGPCLHELVIVSSRSLFVLVCDSDGDDGGGDDDAGAGQVYGDDAYDIMCHHLEGNE